MSKGPGFARVLSTVTQSWRVLGRPVMVRALALGIALGIPAFVLSAGNGVRAVNVLAWAHQSLPMRCAFWAGWLVLSAPALRAVFVAPGSATLRTLRVPHAARLFALFTLCAAVQLPWAVLFARGAGLLAAWGALTASVALSATWVSAGARPRKTAWVAGALGAALIVWDPPYAVVAVVATVSVPFALRIALRDALEQPGWRVKLTRPGSALRALYAAHMLRLLRRERSRLSVALAAAAAGSAGTLLSLRNDPTGRPVQRALIVMALPLTVAAAVCVAPLLDNERRIHGLLRSLRVRSRSVVLAFSLAVITPSSALAATSSVALSVSAQPGSVALSGALLSWAVGLGCSVALWGRLVERRAARGVGTFVAGITVLAVLATIGASSW